MRSGVVQCLKPQFGGQLYGETYNLTPEYVQFGEGADMRHRVEIVVHQILTVKKGYGCVN